MSGRTSANSSVSPTTVKMRPCRLATSTTSSSFLYSAPQPLPRFAPPDRMVWRTMSSADGSKRRLGSRRQIRAGGRSGCSTPEAKGVGQLDAERALSRVLAHRAWVDQRRGWRFTNPSLEDLGLVQARYVSLDDLAADNEAFADAPPELRNAEPEKRKQALVILLDALRHGLAVTSDALDPVTVEIIANAARQTLREPWSIAQQENPRTAAALMIEAPKKAQAGVRGEPLIIRAGPRSGLARQMNRIEI